MESTEEDGVVAKPVGWHKVVPHTHRIGCKLAKGMVPEVMFALVWEHFHEPWEWQLSAAVMTPGGVVLVIVWIVIIIIAE